MKFLGMNMADALLLAIAVFMLLVAAALEYVAMTSMPSGALSNSLIAVGAVFAALALGLVKRVITNPLPIFEHGTDTSYRRKTID